MAVSWILVVAAEYEWPSSKQISRECKDLVRKILVADPKHRISIAGIQVGASLIVSAYVSLTKLERAGHTVPKTSEEEHNRCGMTQQRH